MLLDLGAEGMTQERACAVAVRLLDLGYFRIGNEEYAEENNSFGLTTLERRHVRREGKALVFEFTGKSGIEHTITIDDPGAVEALEVMRRRRGGDDRLLAWKDGRRWRPVDSSLVNEYVGRTTGMEATAKDFRTWHATVIAAASLAEAGGRVVEDRAQAGGRRGDEGGRGVPRQHARAGAVVVRRPPGGGRLRGRAARSRQRPSGSTGPPTPSRQPSSGRCCGC